MKKEDLAELLGIHIGDGCLSENKRYSMYYLGGDITEEKEYHDTWVSHLLNKLMKELKKEKVRYKEYKSTSVYGCYIFDKEIVNFFKKKGIVSGTKINQTIPQFINNKRLTKRFIRGLFDTDGNIYFDKNRSCKNPKNNVPIIKLGTTSEKLCNDVFNCLKDLGFCPRLKKPYKGKKDKNIVYTLLIYRKDDIVRYLNEIGFKNSKHHTKWLVFKKQGFLPPRTTLNQRKAFLQNNKV
jgi:hypothetical protein